MKYYLISGILVIFFLSCSNIDSKENKQDNLEELILPLREVKSAEAYLEQIKIDSAWFYLIKEQAHDQGVAIDTILWQAAKYMENIDAGVVKIENEIIRDKEKLKLIQQKAQNQGIALDSMIRIDAYCEYEKNNK